MEEEQKQALIKVLVNELIEDELKRYKAISNRILSSNSVYQKEILFNELEVSYKVYNQLRGLK